MGSRARGGHWDVRPLRCFASSFSKRHAAKFRGVGDPVRQVNVMVLMRHMRGAGEFPGEVGENTVCARPP